MGNTSSSQQELSSSLPYDQDNVSSQEIRQGSKPNSPLQSPVSEVELPKELELNEENLNSSTELSSSLAVPVPIRNKQLQSPPSFSESPFVGSPLFEPDDFLKALETRLPSPTGSLLSQSLREASQDNDNKEKTASQPVVFGKRAKGSKINAVFNSKINNLVQPESFPSSLSGSEQTLPSLEKKNDESIKNSNCDIPVVDGLPTLISWNSSAKNVYVTGTFNGWKHKIPLNKSVNEFSTVIYFTPGIHHLKFIVDDEWKCSNDLMTATDHEGNLVNYIEVDEQVIPLYDSLQSHSDLSSSPPGEYSTVIPEFNLTGPAPDPFPNHRRNTNDSKKPPLLPSLLEKVLLNAAPLHAEGNSAEEDWLLPVPNHVVLNHLYACSIRDGVMAVAGTSRYRNKYVTTIFYKPVVI